MIFEHCQEITVPGGLWVDDTCHRRAEIRAVTGQDEVSLAGLGPTILPANRCTTLLSRCVLRIGPCTQVTEELMRELTVGDREALLLHLRRITLGDRLECVLNCPEPDCSERLDLELCVSELLLPPYASTVPYHEVRLDGGGDTYLVRFRLPRGVDQEAASHRLAAGKPEEAVAELIGRCVESVRTYDGEIIKTIPELVIRKLPEVLSAHDPQAELNIRICCPACGHLFSVLLDAGAFLLSELGANLENLFREVHWLALHYHWSESEILALSAPRRSRYLELVNGFPSVARIP